MRHFTFVLLFIAQLLRAQPFAVGTRNVSFVDTDRSRTIACALYHPADASGTDVPVSNGAFPVLVMGHGFVMTVDAYTYIGTHFAAQGYIVVLPMTESGFAPDHAAFGADLAFLVSAMQQAGADGTSAFFGHVAPSSAIMGHSMGGGSAFLAAALGPTIQALVGMAPAETTPSAIAAAATVSVPTLVFAASADCVTPIPQHARPMYDALSVPCKAFVNITGGGHCYFGDNSFTCSFGELTCAPDLTISREEQHAVVTDIMDLWLDHFLRGSQAAFDALLDTLDQSPRIVAEHTCGSTSVSSVPADGPHVQVNGNGTITVEGAMIGSEVDVFDALGRRTFHGRVNADRYVPVLSDVPGVALIRVRMDEGTTVLRVIRQ